MKKNIFLRPLLFTVLCTFLGATWTSTAAVAAEDSPPGRVDVIHINDWGAPDHPTVEDPSNGNMARTAPENLRRIGKIFFSKQPNPDRSTPYNPANDEWLTLKDVFGINTDIDLRPSNENNSPRNEGGAGAGYVPPCSASGWSPHFPQVTGLRSSRTAAPSPSYSRGSPPKIICL